MFRYYCFKEFKLARRNMFFLLLMLLPLLTSLAGVGFTRVYSETPKLVLLDSDVRTVPAGIRVAYMPNEERLVERVNDIDYAIGIVNGRIITDGRESEKAVKTAEDVSLGKATDDIGKMPQDTERKILSIALFAAFIGGAALVLKLVEEREFNTVELYKTEPSPDRYPIGAKLLASFVLGAVSFAFSVWILHTPASFLTLAVLYVLGMGLASVLAILVAYVSRNQSQAIAVLKPVSVFIMILPPILGLIFGGLLHKIALVTPFYWLLQLINSVYNGAVAYSYLIALAAAVAVGFLIIIVTWHRSPYGRKKSAA
jgi:hypothetical protein